MAFFPQLATASALAAALALPLTQEQVAAGAARMYAERLASLRAAGELDQDEAFLARLRRIAVGLTAQAAREHPGTAAWAWDVHASSDTAQNADAMAGGKILVSLSYVERLALTDAELAMLLAHEIAHAVLRHNLQEYELALRLEPERAAQPFEELEEAVDHDVALMSKLAQLNFDQEVEADRYGLQLASRAGWTPRQLAGYYRKLAQDTAYPNRDRPNHPSPRQPPARRPRHGGSAGARLALKENSCRIADGRRGARRLS
ncbi:M48 family metalloprotease [Oxalobacteraceae bacterium A2-2]